MNSKVRQAQKEGATLGGISAGLSYSVVKNALYKVIKLKNTQMTSGKTLSCKAARSLTTPFCAHFELLTDREVIRPSISGLMGAYGAALIATQTRTRRCCVWHHQLKKCSMSMEITKTHTRCGKCENNCRADDKQLWQRAQVHLGQPLRKRCRFWLADKRATCPTCTTIPIRVCSITRL